MMMARRRIAASFGPSIKIRVRGRHKAQHQPRGNEAIPLARHAVALRSSHARLATFSCLTNQHRPTCPGERHRPRQAAGEIKPFLPM